MYKTVFITYSTAWLPSRPGDAATWNARIDRMMGKALVDRPAASYAEGLLSYRASALRFGDRRTMALLAALTCQTFIPTPLGNRTLRPLVAQLLGELPNAYSTAQTPAPTGRCGVTYDLRRLRLKGLIERLDHSHCSSVPRSLDGVRWVNSAW